MDIFKLFAAATLVVAAPAAAVVIDFEAGPSGGQANGFSATGAPGVTFFSANGSGLSLGNFGSQGNGNSLAVFNDSNGNFLIVKIAGGATGVSLGFGNDDPSFTNASDLATLKLFNGVVNFATVTSALNRDDVYNQTISYTGSFFDSFSFAYTNAAGSPFTGGNGRSVGTIEVVDDINITTAAVPEPASWALLIAGFGLTGAAMRRRRVAVAA